MSGHAAGQAPESFMSGHGPGTADAGRGAPAPWEFLRAAPGAGLSPGLLYHHLAWPFAKLVMYLGVGLFIGQMLESLGWSARVGKWCSP